MCENKVASQFPRCTMEMLILVLDNLKKSSSNELAHSRNALSLLVHTHLESPTLTHHFAVFSKYDGCISLEVLFWSQFLFGWLQLVKVKEPVQ